MTEMFQTLPEHYALFFQTNMVGYELNYGIDGQHIGRISGNLARSVGTKYRPYYASVIINDSGIAPYANKVNDWTKKNYGAFILNLAVNRLHKEMLHQMRVEFHRAANNIESGKSYTYRNPFYS
jgi:hypothetical protein